MEDGAGSGVTTTSGTIGDEIKRSYNVCKVNHNSLAFHFVIEKKKEKKRSEK